MHALSLPSLVGSHLPTLAILATALAPIAGCAAGDDALARGTASLEMPAPSPDWPAAEGWSAETFPFPLFFAPELDHRGVEELRFAPGYGDEAAPDHFTYAFYWWLEDEAPASAEAFEAELTTYFAGLARRFDAASFDPAAHRAELAREAAGWGTAYSGRVTTVDPFHGSRPVVLSAEIEVERCGGRPLVVFRFSPRPRGSEVWRVLSAQTSALRCR